MTARLRELGVPLRTGVGGTGVVRAPGWGEPRPVHTARFDLDESALPVGVACMAAAALTFLG